MGETMMGSPAKQVGKVELMTPEQRRFLGGFLGNINPKKLARQTKGLMEGYDEDLFQSSIVDPAMKQYEEQILPAIQQRFVDSNSAASSALNQTLTQSAGDLSNVLAGQKINLQQSMSGQQLGALSAILSLLGQRSFDPLVQGPTSGLLKDIIAGGAGIGAGYLASSKEIKDNIIDYEKGIETVRQLRVKQYDYTIPVEGSQKGRVGLIAEDVPEELTGDLNGIKAVDLYGLVAVLINSVKHLDAQVKTLEEKCQSYSKV